MSTVAKSLKCVCWAWPKLSGSCCGLRLGGEQGAPPALPAPAGTFAMARPPQGAAAISGAEPSTSWLQYVAQIHSLNCGGKGLHPCFDQLHARTGKREI